MTISDIAKLAGVSNAAVSRYLNGGSLSEEKYQAIRRVIEQTGYRPDAAAQTLRTGRINQIGVLVPKLDTEHMGQVIAGILGELHSSRYMMLLDTADFQQDKEMEALARMQNNRVDGVILVGNSFTRAHSRALRACRVPLVIAGQQYPEVASVGSDNRAMARELTGRMLQRGRRQIVFLGLPEYYISIGADRLAGAQQALADAGLDGAAMPRVVCEPGDAASGCAGMQQLLAACPQLDGVVCATDLLAMGALEALRQAGRRVPQDVSVAGIGDSSLCTMASPPLTSVRLYMDQGGAEAARLLLQMIRQDNTRAQPLRQVVMGYTLVERGSV